MLFRIPLLITDFFDEHTQPDISLVESLFPFAGVSLLSSSFSAFELTVEARHELMAAHYSSIVPFSRLRESAARNYRFPHHAFPHTIADH